MDKWIDGMTQEDAKAALNIARIEIGIDEDGTLVSAYDLTTEQLQRIRDKSDGVLC